MKILQIHKYYTKKRGGGSVTAFFETVELLRKKGHEVIIFSMNDPENYPTKYQKYFTKHFDLNKKSFWQKIILIPKTIYNKEAQQNLEKLILEEKPDVAHVHNIYHYLTPAIFHTVKKHNIPIIFKLSDYKVICPNRFLFNKGSLCEKCKGGRYYQCFLNKCERNSWAFSFIAMIEAYVHKWLKSYEKIDLFLAPSEFMKGKCIEFGIPEEKIQILRNVMNLKSYAVKEDNNEKEYFLSIGRLSEEKGIDKLILATKELKSSGRLGGNKLLIAGDGPEKGKLKKLVQDLGLKGEVKFLGKVLGEKRDAFFIHSKFVILPSIWFDNSPLIISEAGAFEKPVIVSDLGGSSEMVIENETGFVCSALQVNELAETIHRILKLKKEEREEMGRKGRRFIEKINSEKEYYEKLMKYYEKNYF